jgi:hypothetical protein
MLYGTSIVSLLTCMSGRKKLLMASLIAWYPAHARSSDSVLQRLPRFTWVYLRTDVQSMWISEIYYTRSSVGYSAQDLISTWLHARMRLEFQPRYNTHQVYAHKTWISEFESRVISILGTHFAWKFVHVCFWSFSRQLQRIAPAARHSQELHLSHIVCFGILDSWWYYYSCIYGMRARVSHAYSLLIWRRRKNLRIFLLFWGHAWFVRSWGHSHSAVETSNSISSCVNLIFIYHYITFHLNYLYVDLP